MELEWKILEYQKPNNWRKDNTERRNMDLVQQPATWDTWGVDGKKSLKQLTVSTVQEPDNGRILAEGCYMHFITHYVAEVIFTKQHAKI